MAHLLVIEDEPRLALAIQRGLQDEGYAADVVRDGLLGLDAARNGHHDLLLLDLMLPGLPGLELCRRLRAGGSTVPVLVLTARDDPADVVKGLDAGADDYLAKPFAFEVLLARVRALLRRGSAQPSSRYHCGPVELDTATHEAWRDGVAVTLSAKEFQILELLMRRPGAVLSRARIAAALYEADMEPESNSIEVHVANLRRKLDRERAAPLIHTIRGVGYALRWEGAP